MSFLVPRDPPPFNGKGRPAKPFNPLSLNIPNKPLSFIKGQLIQEERKHNNVQGVRSPPTTNNSNVLIFTLSPSAKDKRNQTHEIISIDDDSTDHESDIIELEYLPSPGGFSGHRNEVDFQYVPVGGSMIAFPTKREDDLSPEDELFDLVLFYDEITSMMETSGVSILTPYQISKSKEVLSSSDFETFLAGVIETFIKRGEKEQVLNRQYVQEYVEACLNPNSAVDAYTKGSKMILSYDAFAIQSVLIFQPGSRKTSIIKSGKDDMDPSTFPIEPLDMKKQVMKLVLLTKNHQIPERAQVDGAVCFTMGIFLLWCKELSLAPINKDLNLLWVVLEAATIVPDYFEDCKRKRKEQRFRKMKYEGKDIFVVSYAALKDYLASGEIDEKNDPTPLIRYYKSYGFIEHPAFTTDWCCLVEPLEQNDQLELLQTISMGWYLPLWQMEETGTLMLAKMKSELSQSVSKSKYHMENMIKIRKERIQKIVIEQKGEWPTSNKKVRRREPSTEGRRRLRKKIPVAVKRKWFIRCDLD